MKDYRVEIVHVYVQAADEEEAITEAIIKLEDRPELYFVPVLLKEVVNNLIDKELQED